MPDALTDDALERIVREESAEAIGRSSCDPWRDYGEAVAHRVREETAIAELDNIVKWSQEMCSLGEVLHLVEKRLAALRGNRKS